MVEVKSLLETEGKENGKGRVLWVERFYVRR
jgi:hypothetical protein